MSGDRRQHVYCLFVTTSMKTPRVSVVLPTYNHAQFLPQAVGSVLAQTFADFELIIVNDGSTDHTRDYLATITDTRVRVVNQENQRLPRALNNGFAAARGGLLAWTSADNYCAPVFLEALVAALDAHPDAGMAVGTFAFVDAASRIRGPHRVIDLSLPAFLSLNPGVAAFLYRRQCLETVGSYEPELDGAEDWDMWLRIAERYSAVLVPELIYYYRLHEDSMTARIPERVAAASRRVIERALERRGGQVDLQELYPFIRDCANPELATTHAAFDFGTRLLRSHAAPPELAVQFLTAAFERQPDPGIAANLMVAFARCGDRDSVSRLVAHLQTRASRQVRELVQLVQLEKNPAAAALRNAPVFLLNEKSELIQRLRQRQAVYSFTAHLAPVPGGASPQPSPVADADAEPFLAKAQEAFDRGNLTDACAAMSEAAARAPRSAAIQQALGSMLFQTGEMRQANAAFDRALAVAPDDIPLLMKKAVTAIQADDIDGFEKALGRVLELDPGNHDARRFLVKVNIQAGRYLDAAKELVALTGEMPEDVELWVALGTCLAKLRDSDHARTAFQRALQLSPDNALAKENLDALFMSPTALAAPAIPTPPPAAGEPLLTVIITTYNRPDLLERCLTGFVGQSILPSQFEIVVVDDGSETSVEAIVRKFTGRLRMTYHYQANSGLAAARNTGIALARGTILVPYDDDDVPHADCLQEHLNFHRAHPDVEDAMLANLEWLPGLEVTPVMHYITEVDPRLWCLKGLKPGQSLPFGYLWGGCSSYKKELIRRAGGFDARFRFGYEDTEAEVRMRRHGLRVWWHPAARNFVANSVTYEAFCRRCYRQGRSLRVFQQMYPHDPQVKAYADTSHAGEVVARTEQVIQAQQPLIASLLKAGWTLPEKSSVAKKESIELLHQLLFLSFEYWKNKGVLDAVNEPVLAIADNGHRVLVIAPELPAHDRASGAFRLFQLVKLLREAGHQVTFLARAAAGGLDPKPYIRDLQALGVEVISCDPEKIEARWGIKVQAPRVDLKRLLAERRFDVAYIYFYEVAEQYAEEIRVFSPATKIVVDSVDIHFLREERRAELEKDSKMAAQAGETRRRELAVYGKADQVLVVTDADAAVLKAALPAANIGVLPNVHPVPAQPVSFDQRRDLLFVGGFQHHPNVDAMLYFAREVWPGIACRLTDARLFIVGDRPPQEIQQLAGERIVVT